MRVALLALLLCALSAAHAQQLPPLALQYAPILREEIAVYWGEMSLPSALAATVEQETCYSLKHKGCWNPHTELKTAREYGFGLGQITVTERFNVFNEVKALDRTLKEWQWSDRYDPRMQLRALVLKEKQNYGVMTFAATDRDRLAFTFAAYNGGIGGVLSDRKVCQATRGCDPGRWFGHIQNTSLKSRAKWQGYGQSPFDINRDYVNNVLNVRRPKYVPIMGGL